MWKAPLFWQPGKCVYFFAQRFVEASCSLGIQWADCYICLTLSNKWVQKIKGQYMPGSTFWTIKYMNGYVLSKVRYMNGVDFEILAHTPVLIYPQVTPTPTPHEDAHCKVTVQSYQGLHWELTEMLTFAKYWQRKPWSDCCSCMFARKKIPGKFYKLISVWMDKTHKPH